MSFAVASVMEFRKMLTNLDGWLRKAEAHAKTKSFDVNVLMQAFTTTIARGLSLVASVLAGLTFAFGEGGSKRGLAGVLFGESGSSLLGVESAKRSGVIAERDLHFIYENGGLLPRMMWAKAPRDEARQNVRVPRDRKLHSHGRNSFDGSNRSTRRLGARQRAELLHTDGGPPGGLLILPVPQRHL